MMKRLQSGNAGVPPASSGTVPVPTGLVFASWHKSGWRFSRKRR